MSGKLAAMNQIHTQPRKVCIGIVTRSTVIGRHRKRLMQIQDQKQQQRQPPKMSFRQRQQRNLPSTVTIPRKVTKKIVR